MELKEKQVNLNLKEIQEATHLVATEFGANPNPFYVSEMLNRNITNLLRYNQSSITNLNELIVWSAMLANQYGIKLAKVQKSFIDTQLSLEDIGLLIPQTIGIYENHNQTTVITDKITPLSNLVLNALKIVESIYPNSNTEELKPTLYQCLSTTPQQMFLEHDNTINRTLQNALPLLEKTKCPFAMNAAIMGAPDWNNNLSIEENIIHIFPHFMKFHRIGMIEKLDMFIIEVSELGYVQSLKDTSRLFKEVHNQFQKLSTVNYLDIDDPKNIGWDFHVNGQNYFTITFNPYYSENHARQSHVRGSTFITFQPNYSFTNNGIGSKFPRTPKIKQAIRRNFINGNMPYDVEIASSKYQYKKAIKPMKIGEEAIDWTQQ
jgi:hypothetical protein